MPMPHRLAPAVALTLAAVFATAACGPAMSSGGDTMTHSPMPSGSMTHSPMPSESMTHSPMPSGSATAAAMLPGAYLTQAEYAAQMDARHGSTVVYFFHAPWCPDCRATEASLTADGVPEGLTVVKVDYDTATDLKKQFGVTQQHTFVVLDAMGHEVKKFTGATFGADIKRQAA